MFLKLNYKSLNKEAVSLVQICGLTILVFFIIFDIELSFIPYLTTARIGLLFILVKSALNKKFFFNATYFYGITLFSIALLYSFSQTIISKDNTQTIRLFWFLIYGWILPHCFVTQFHKKDTFLLSVFFATVLQSVFVFLMFFNLELRYSILTFVKISTNITGEETLQRALGLTSLTGASFSITQSMGVFCGIGYLGRRKRNLGTRIIFGVLLITVLLSTLLIGRTGLLLSILFLAYFFLFHLSWRQKAFFLVVFFLIFTQFDFLSFIQDSTGSVSGFNPDMFFAWITEAFSYKDNTTINVLSSMKKPSINYETLLGTGLVVDKSGMGNASQNDSGYIQTYYSLGLFGALFFYASYLILSLIYWLNGRNGGLSLVLLISVFIIEYKEPFIFKYSLPFVLTTILFYGAKYEAKLEN